MDIFCSEIYSKDIYTKEKYLDWDKSGTKIMGLYADLQGIAIVICKAYPKKIRWDIVDSWYSKNINIDNAENRYFELLKKHSKGYPNIRYIIANSNGRLISDDIVKCGCRQFELRDEKPETLAFAVQSNIHKLSISKSIKGVWENELENFDLDTTTKISYPLTYALGLVLAGCTEVRYL
ncbi:MAG: hypothetical protein AAFS12_04700 [Cyanobacteria bacterium J06632_19]